MHLILFTKKTPLLTRYTFSIKWANANIYVNASILSNNSKSSTTDLFFFVCVMTEMCSHLMLNKFRYNDPYIQ